ncbi:hypothetical protein PUN28_000172 [Cardiocondyla obscurior]|uniref:Uncharacterized protein n=1 Tax=Cardiocondyla obscurior TaxID=286306 RepID=A0AAW2GY67_9HYME
MRRYLQTLTSRMFQYCATCRTRDAAECSSLKLLVLPPPPSFFSPSLPHHRRNAAKDRERKREKKRASSFLLIKVNANLDSFIVGKLDNSGDQLPYCKLWYIHESHERGIHNIF